MRALKISATGMTAQQMRVEVIANNLANMNTTAYNARRAEFADLHYQQIKRAGSINANDGTVLPAGVQLGLGVRPTAISMIVSQGGLAETGGELDLAIDGPGFFQFEKPDGTPVFKRNGSLQLSADGQLVSADGFPLNPPINLPQNVSSFSISNDGSVLAEIPDQPQPQNLGQINLVKFQNPGGLNPQGGGQFAESAASGNPAVGQPGREGFGKVLQGFLETSNVDIVDTQVNLITQQRAFQANAQSIRAADENLGTIVNIKK